MMDNIKKYHTEADKQEKNQKQKDNWITTEEIETICDKLKTNVKPLRKEKGSTTKELLQIQDFVILNLYTLIPPRRCMDFTEFKINNINKKKIILWIRIIYYSMRIKVQLILKIPKDLKSIFTKYK